MKKVLLTLTLAILATFGWSQCEIGFTATVSNDTVILNPYDSSSTIGYNAWNAPGGTPSNQALPITTNATVIYSTAGTYEICVECMILETHALTHSAIASLSPTVVEAHLRAR